MASSTEDLIKKIMKSEDFYELLGVEKEAGDPVILKAYRKLALKLHPDKCSLPQGEDAFKKVSNAFSVLKDSDQRAHYDRFGSAPGGESMSSQQGFPFGGRGGGGGVHGMSPEELFREMFRQQHGTNAEGFDGGEGGNRRERRGGGIPGGGMNFSSFGGGANGGGPQMINLSLPEPFASAWGILSRVIPTPFLFIGVIFVFTYAFSWMMSLILRNFIYVLLLSYAPFPLPSSLKKFVWLAFFIGGFLGYF